MTRVQEAQEDFDTAVAGITDQTPLRQAAEQFNAAVVALEMAWLQLLGASGCLPDEQQQEAAEAAADMTRTLQQALADASYYQGEVDGVYGPETVDATAGGLVFSALQDGWVVAYNDDTLEELWRFNLGTPLKGSPVTYAIGPKQYLAVQTSGRHLHPVKFDKLENSSYLFVFALN